MTTPRDIIRVVGTAEAAERLGVSQGAVRLQISRGHLPAKWFDVLERMCAEVGQNCPRSAFTFNPDPASPEAQS